MSQGLRLVGAVALASLGTAACGFETSRNVLVPTNGPGGVAPSTVGVWTSQSFAGALDPGSCGNFEWKITSQTPSSMAGDFSASCLGGTVEVTGSASGHVNGAVVPMTANGQAVASGMPACPFALTGTGHILSEKSMRVEYNGTTCLGPLAGSETLTKRDPEPPPPPAPPPPPPPPPDAPPPPNPYHVGSGPESEDRARQVVNNTAAEFPYNTAPHHDVRLKVALTEDLLRRTIWHLRLAGFTAGRQQNPSGAISTDKLTVVVDGRWIAVDIFTNFDVPGVPLGVIWWPVTPAHHIHEAGVPD
jgi:hypothetical protein